MSASGSVGRMLGALVATPDAEIDADRQDAIPTEALVVGGVLLVVLVVGLRAIKRQRDEGRRSKFPPIG